MSETYCIPPRAAHQRLRVGVVSFINTLPLIDGLDGLQDVELKHTVPSLLIEKLLEGEVDVALCSSIDYQRSKEPLVILPVGLLGCDGPTLTVRLFSQVPIAEISRIHCDTDSHTSVALLQILLAELHGLTPELVDFDARAQVAENQAQGNPQCMLLIGDKVVTDSPPAVRYPHQLDLGEAWRGLTGKPFVFALWMARKGTDPSLLKAASMVLDHQRRHNRQRIDTIIHQNAQPRNWPADLARSYLRDHITYQCNDAHLESLGLFYEKARAQGLIDHLRPVELFKV